MRKTIILFSCMLLVGLCSAQDDMLLSEHGTALFISEAPLEIIQAESGSLRGVINPGTRSFAFTLKINSFDGFNSDIQRTHFLENYMEQRNFPQATFTGKIIEDISFDVPGVYTVRAKGLLNIHGINKERIIKGTLTIKPGSAHITSDFSVPLSDHGIAIPKIVRQKISEEIAVTIDINFAQGSKS